MALVTIAQLPAGKQVKHSDLLPVIQDGVTGALPPSALTPMALQPAPFVHAIMSPWKRHGVGSGQYNQSNAPNAVLIKNLYGCDIVGAGCHVQGGLGTSPVPVIELGVYSQGADGFPDQLLVMKAIQPTGGGAYSVDFDSPILASAHGPNVYLAFALYGSLQFSNSENSGAMSSDVPYFNLLGLNGATTAGDFIVSASSITGTGTSRVWPTSWGTAGINTANTFPNLALRIRRAS